MIIVDTNVWIGHFRGRTAMLKPHLEEAEVLMHPLILGELSLGTYNRRELILEYLAELPMALEATHSEILTCIETRQLYGKGIGIADTAILCSALLTPNAVLMTIDRRLAAIAQHLGVSYA